MISINIGQITEKKRAKKKWYEIYILDGVRSASFSNIEEAIIYIKKHTLTIFGSNNVSSLHVKYINFSGLVHYLIFQKTEDDEIIVFEETKFDFLRTHPHKSTKYKLRRMINEKNYSFSDVLRVTINWHPFFSIWNSIILFFLLVGSGLFLIYGLDYLNTKSVALGTFFKVLTFATFFISLGLIFFISVIHIKTRYALFQISGDFKEINWKKWHLIRMSQLISSLFVSSISLTVIIALITETFNINSAFKVILFINLSFWLLNFITSFIMLFYSYSKKRFALKKYFSKNEIKMFRKWFKNPERKEIVKRNDIFLFEDSYSNNLTRKAVDLVIEKMKWTTRAQLKKERKKELKIKRMFIENYDTFGKEN